MKRVFGIWPWLMLLAPLSVFLAEHPAPDLNITVRVIDPYNGRPVQGLKLWLFLGNPLPHWPPLLEGHTGPEGTAVFHLKTPFPDQLFVDDESARVTNCSHGLFGTDQVIREGVVGDNVCDRKGKWKGKFTVKPGEIIVFIHKLRWWENFSWFS